MTRRKYLIGAAILALVLIAVAPVAQAAMCVACTMISWPDPNGGPSEPCTICLYDTGERSGCRDRPGNGCTKECLTLRDGCDR